MPAALAAARLLRGLPLVPAARVRRRCCAAWSDGKSASAAVLSEREVRANGAARQLSGGTGNLRQGFRAFGPKPRRSLRRLKDWFPAQI